MVGPIEHLVAAVAALLAGKTVGFFHLNFIRKVCLGVAVKNPGNFEWVHNLVYFFLISRDYTNLPSNIQ